MPAKIALVTQCWSRNCKGRSQRGSNICFPQSYISSTKALRVFYLRNFRNCWGSSQNKYSGPVCSYLCSSCDHMHIVDSRFPSTKRCDEAYNILLPSTNRKQAPCPHIIFLGSLYNLPLSINYELKMSSA